VLRLVREVTTDRRGGARQLRDALQRHVAPPGSGTRVSGDVLREQLMLRDRVRCFPSFFESLSRDMRAKPCLSDPCVCQPSHRLCLRE
jgi:hypothetical protein